MADVPDEVARLSARMAAHELEDARRHQELREDLANWRREGNESRSQVYGLLNDELRFRRGQTAADGKARRTTVSSVVQKILVIAGLVASAAIGHYWPTPATEVVPTISPGASP